MKPVDKPSTSFSRKKSQEPSPAAFIQEDLNSKLSRMSLKLKAKMKKVDKLENNNSSKLTSAESTAYRACVARGNCCGLDRPNLQYAAKEVSRYMSAPLECDIAALKRLARYVNQYPRVVLVYHFAHA